MSEDFDAKRTWKGWFEGFFIPPGTRSDETSTPKGDPTLENGGYQLSAAEEETSRRYDTDLLACRDEDFSDVEGHKFLSIAGKDLEGNIVVLVVARHLPANVENPDRLYRFLIRKLDDVVSQPFSVVYVHTESSYWEHSPGVMFLRQSYERLPVKYKRHLTKFFILHSDISLWATATLVCPFLSHNFWGKMRNISRLEYLWDHISKGNIAAALPSFVCEHDAVLEEQPLHDYGFIDTRQEMQMPGMPAVE